MKDSLQTAGKTPEDKDKLNSKVSKTFTTETNFSSMDGVRQTGLGLFWSLLFMQIE
jgi:hypothetical protein